MVPTPWREGERRRGASGPGRRSPRRRVAAAARSLSKERSVSTSPQVSMTWRMRSGRLSHEEVTVACVPKGALGIALGPAAVRLGLPRRRGREIDGARPRRDCARARNSEWWSTGFVRPMRASGHEGIPCRSPMRGASSVGAGGGRRRGSGEEREGVVTNHHGKRRSGYKPYLRS